MATQILIVEDDTSLNKILALHFEDQGFKVTSAYNCENALERMKIVKPQLVLLDQQLPDGFGIDLLPQILKYDPSIRIIMMTGEHDLELAIKAISQGAMDFIHKPVKTKILQASVDKALAHKKTQPLKMQEAPDVKELIGRSNAMLQVSKDIALSAESDATVLIAGESGTGKEVVARLVHQYSKRSGPFIAINCAAIVDTLLESELFGHEKGAFTGANSRKMGKIEQADHGTLFLDEIAELALPLQAKLLRALQEKTFDPVGSTKSIHSDVRIIAASHKDLFEQAQLNHFREDLAYRLSVINIKLPPLRERKEDIALLATALLEKTAKNLNRNAPPIDDNALEKLLTYDWPGNVRELENVLTQAMVQARDGNITVDTLTFRSEITSVQTKDVASPIPELQSLDEIEAIHIQRILNHTHGHKGKSCDILGISRPALDRKIKKYKLLVP